MILPIQTVILPGRREKKSTKREEHRRKKQQIRPFRRIFAPKRGVIPVVKETVAHLGNGEERADGQVEQAGEENAVALADLAGQGLQVRRNE